MVKSKLDSATINSLPIDKVSMDMSSILSRDMKPFVYAPQTNINTDTTKMKAKINKIKRNIVGNNALNIFSSSDY